jgi:oligoendopeptidase F
MRSLVRCGMFIALLGIVGCGSDPREALINSTIEYLKQAANDITTIKERVDEAVKKQENKKLSAKELKEAYSAIDSLKEVPKKLQIAKQRIESVSGSTTAEQRESLRQQFQQKLSSAMARIEEERLALEKSIVAAEAVDADSVKDLRSKLTEAEGSFEMLARQR